MIGTVIYVHFAPQASVADLTLACKSIGFFHAGRIISAVVCVTERDVTFTVFTCVPDWAKACIGRAVNYLAGSIISAGEERAVVEGNFTIDT